MTKFYLKGIDKTILFLTMSIATITGCDKKQEFNNLDYFKDKAPSELLSDPVIGKVMKSIIPAEQMKCLDDTFNYMPDISKFPDGSIGAEQSGSHADSWRYSYMRLTKDGDIDLIQTCSDDTEHLKPYMFYTNRDIKEPVPESIKEWLASNAEREIGDIIITDGKNKITISPDDLLHRNKVNGATSLSEQKTLIKSFAETSCNNPPLKYGYYNDGFSKTITTLDNTQVCEAIEKARKNLLSSIDKGSNNYCEIADDIAKEKGGYDAAREWINTIELNQNEMVLRTLVNACHPSNREKFVANLAAETKINLYSAGTIHSTFRTCPAVMFEISSKEGGNKLYYLQGLDSCNQISTMPIATKEHGGDDIFNDYKYDGLMPTYFIFNGKTKAFYGNTIGTPQSNQTTQTQQTSNHQSGRRYALAVADQLSSNQIQACQLLGSTIRSLANSGNPDYIIERQVDSVLNHAPSVCLY